MRLFSSVVPRVGIEPTLLAKYDFESYASTNSATEAFVVASLVQRESTRKLSEIHYLQFSPGCLEVVW